MATAAWTAVILAITLWPSQPTDGGWVRTSLTWLYERGLPTWVTYDTIEITANVLLFVPLGYLLSRSLSEHPRSLSEQSESKGPLLWPTVLALSLSLLIEFTQSTFLPARFPTASDLIANTAGAFLGAALAALTSRPARRRAPTPGP